ncbi:MAG: Maf family protein [Phycisphaeraceae bacterium]|nr:Maf family protein [Phycisphaeraceae bacterium]
MPQWPHVLLASRSPRRASLLAEAGVPFTQIDPPFADPPSPASEAGDAIAHAIELAGQKAESCLKGTGYRVRGKENPLPPTPYPVPRTLLVVLIAADTIVVNPDGLLLGQPQGIDEARTMLKSLLGREHQVVTGVMLIALRDGVETRRLSLADVARVTLGPVSPTELDAFLEQGRWRGKAGGYNLAELEGRWPVKVQGDPGTVVGLPMRRILPILREWGDGSPADPT